MLHFDAFDVTFDTMFCKLIELRLNYQQVGELQQTILLRKSE